MVTDLVVALGKSSVQGQTFIGCNLYGDPNALPELIRYDEQEHAAGEVIPLGDLTIPQVKNTFRIQGCRQPHDWGLRLGCNEHQVAIGVTHWQSKLPPASAGLNGTDLVRLTLERGASARNAVDVLTDLIERHGHKGDHVFLIADGREAFVLEAAGKYWALIQCHQMRALADCALIRQDWERLSRGLAEHILAQNWWPDDGSKLDFIGSLGDPALASPLALKRWSRATLALAGQEGALDGLVLRQLLAEHCEQFQQLSGVAPTLCSSIILELSADAEHPLMFWHANHATGAGIYYPFTLNALIPEQSHGLTQRTLVREVQEHMQAQFDHETEQFLTQVRSMTCKMQKRVAAQEFHQRQWERWERLTSGRKEASLPKPKRTRADEMLSFVSE